MQGLASFVKAYADRRDEMLALADALEREADRPGYYDMPIEELRAEFGRLRDILSNRVLGPPGVGIVMGFDGKITRQP